MRLKQSRLKQYHHRAAIPKKTGEGGSYVEYAKAVSFKAEEWPAGGKIQAERYGIRLPNILNLRISGGYREITTSDGKVAFEVDSRLILAVNDGICLYVPEYTAPDYRIIAIYPYRFLTLEVERI